MASEIGTSGPSGVTFYFVVENGAGQAWNTSTVGFETAIDGHWANYAVTMAEQGTMGKYRGNFPSAIPTSATGGLYRVDIRLQAGGSPARGDSPYSAGTFDWTGTQAVPLNAAAGTVGGALLVAEGVGIGKIVEDDVANTLTVYARDNTTVLRTFTLTPSGAGALSRT